MNLVCAYCGVNFTDRGAISGDDSLFSGARKWCVLVAALLLPFVGVVAGVPYVMSDNATKRSAGRLWLIAGLCSSLVYVGWWMR